VRVEPDRLGQGYAGSAEALAEAEESTSVSRQRSELLLDKVEVEALASTCTRGETA
jgi:hypothetical protein